MYSFNNNVVSPSSNVNYSNNNPSPRTNYPVINYNNNNPQMNYNNNVQSQSQVSYYPQYNQNPSTVTYNFQPVKQQQQQVIPNNNNNNVKQNGFSYVTVNQPQTGFSQQQNVQTTIQQSPNVISYSFNQTKTKPKPTSTVSPRNPTNTVKVHPTTTTTTTVTTNNNTTNYHQINCSKCQAKLAYPQGAKGVFCPLCQNVTPIVKMDFIICGNCQVTLTFPSGANYVKCQKCNVVNLNPYNIKK